MSDGDIGGGGGFDPRPAPFRAAPPPLPHQQPYTLDPDDGASWYRNKWIWFLLAGVAVVGGWIVLALTGNDGTDNATCDRYESVRADLDAGAITTADVERSAAELVALARDSDATPLVTTAAVSLEAAAASGDANAVTGALARFDQVCAA